ncbi:MAG: hypothetical protein QMC67_11980 [Candidatus Wallbacteria bacterium]
MNLKYLNKKSILFLALAAAISFFYVSISLAQESVSEKLEMRDIIKGGDAELQKKAEILKKIDADADDDITFLKKSYQLLLKKEISEKDLTYWIKKIKEKQSRISIIARITSSNNYYLKNEITGTVTGKNVKLLSTSDEKAARIATIPQNKQFKVTAQHEHYYNVRFEDGLSGFLKSEDISIEVPEFGSDAPNINELRQKNSNLNLASNTEKGNTTAGVLNFETALSAEIKKIREIWLKLKTCLLFRGNFSVYELNSAQLVEGEKFLNEFRGATSDFTSKSEIFNAKNPIKQRIKIFTPTYDGLNSYSDLQKLIEIQLSNFNAVAVEAFADGKTLVPYNYFELKEGKNTKKILEWLKQETGSRHMKKYALIDIFNFGETFFKNKKDYFMKNAFGQYSNSVKPGLYFVDFTNPAVESIILDYIDTVADSEYFDGIIINNLKYPENGQNPKDIRTHFIFGDNIIKEFEINTKFNMLSLTEEQEEFLKKFAISRLGDFVLKIRERLMKKKIPFYAICDGEYYMARYDTRLCDFKQWGTRLDGIFISYEKANLIEILDQSIEISKKLSKPQVIVFTKYLPELMEQIRELNDKNSLIKGILFK